MGGCAAGCRAYEGIVSQSETSKQRSVATAVARLSLDKYAVLERPSRRRPSGQRHRGHREDMGACGGQDCVFLYIDASILKRWPLGLPSPATALALRRTARDFNHEETKETKGRLR